MRPYRGLTKDGKWVCGNFCNLAGLSYISEYPVGAGFDEVTEEKSITGWYKVIPSTVGQSTGKFDKNGDEIFEGMICRIPTGYEFVVKMQMFCLGVSGSKCWGYHSYEDVEIVPEEKL